MLNRQKIEERELAFLSPYACFSKDSKGRLYEEKECDIRTIFQHDRDRIIHSKAFRRLKHKTQVFIVPEGDHYRTRLTHTLEVSQIARTIARALTLNEDLTEAVALGHDLGHTPFGHAGELALDEIRSTGFSHNKQSLRVVDVIEGLNLSFEVRDGILNHTGDKEPLTLEGQIVRIADRIAYINHDLDDAVRAGIINKEDIPAELTEVLGDSNSARINKMIRDIIESSSGLDEIRRSEKVKEAAEKLRSFLFENIYIGSIAKKEESKAVRLIKELYRYYMTYPEEVSPNTLQEENKEQIIVDYIAGMTDTYAIKKWQEINIPKPWREKK